MKYEFFLAYRGVNADEARALHDALRARGRLVYLDTTDRSTRSVTGSIPGSLQRSFLPVIIVGRPGPLGHPYFEGEVRRAIERARRPDGFGLAVVMLPNAREEDVPAGIETQSVERWQDDAQAVADRLIERLEGRLSETPLAADALRLLGPVLTWAQRAEGVLPALQRAWRRTVGGDPREGHADHAPTSVARRCLLQLGTEAPPPGGAAPRLLHFALRLRARMEGERAAAMHGVLAAIAAGRGLDLGELARAVAQADTRPADAATVLLLHALRRDEGGDWTVSAWTGEAREGGDWLSPPRRLGETSVPELAELGEALPRWLAECDAPSDRLRFELVTPLGHLCCGPEDWQPLALDGRAGATLGRKMDVVVRILERADPVNGGWANDANYRSDWRAAFETAWRCADGLEAQRACDPDMPEILQDHPGCLLPSRPLVGDDRRALLVARVPVAVWPRGEAAIDQPGLVDLDALNPTPPRRWRDAVQGHRRDRRGRGHPAVLLWDDPARLVPDESY